jgi:hypothetical protein
MIFGEISMAKRKHRIKDLFNEEKKEPEKKEDATDYISQWKALTKRIFNDKK